MPEASNFPDQPGSGDRDANQLQNGNSSGRDPDDLPDGGGDDDKGEDEKAPE